MTRSQKFFRYVWRVNAVVILIAAGAVVFGVGGLLVSEFGTRVSRSREAKAGPVLPGAEMDSRFSLGHAVMVPGSEVMRADLVVRRGGEGFSSGGYSETRNILFIQPGVKTARWLLPDNDHVIVDTTELVDDRDTKLKRTVATVALVKPATEPTETATGRLIVFDPPGKKVVEVADGVRDVHIASLSGQELSILYERDRRLVVAALDAASLAARTEQGIDLPALK